MNKLSIWAMAAFYTLAGMMHFINPSIYLRFMPPYLPRHIELIYISGTCEILFAFLIIPKASRYIASLLIIALLIAIFPANIHMAVDSWHNNNPYRWLAILRLPLQFLLIYWAWKAGRYEQSVSPFRSKP